MLLYFCCHLVAKMVNGHNESDAITGNAPVLFKIYLHIKILALQTNFACLLYIRV